MIVRQCWSDFHHMGQSVAGLKCGNNPLQLTAQLKRFQSLNIGDRHILRAANFMQPCMFRTNARIIEPS